MIALLGILQCSLLLGQSSMYSLAEGVLLPVYEIRAKTPYCFTGDRLVRTGTETLTQLSSERFGEGFLEVEILENKRAGVIREGEELRFVRQSAWYEFTARVTATEAVIDGYCVMRFDSFGEASYVCRSLGDMELGESRVVSILTHLDYEMPKQIHFYSGTEEIRTNLIPDRYTYEYGRFLLAAN